MQRVIIREQRHRDRALELVREAPEGREVIVKKYVPSKTIPQLAYCFGVVYRTIIAFVEESYGETFTPEEMHRWMKKQILGVEYKEFDGEVIEREYELRKSDRKAWQEYIDCVIRYCWSRWGLMIPAPEWKHDEFQSNKVAQ
jgi:hypothetical protein